MNSSKKKPSVNAKTLKEDSFVTRPKPANVVISKAPKRKPVSKAPTAAKPRVVKSNTAAKKPVVKKKNVTPSVTSAKTATPAKRKILKKKSQIVNAKTSKDSDAKQQAKLEQAEKESQEDAEMAAVRERMDAHNQAVNDRLRREREEKKRQLELRETMLAPSAVDGVCYIDIKLLQECIDRAQEAGKTPLVVDSTERVDTYFRYQNTILLQAKGLVVKTLIGKTHTKAEVLEESRKLLVSALKNGMTFWIDMSNSAADFSESGFHDPEVFPVDKVFTAGLLLDGKECNFVRDSEKQYGSFFPKPEFNVVITSHFERADYREFLEQSLPFDKLQVIVVLQEGEGPALANNTPVVCCHP